MAVKFNRVDDRCVEIFAFFDAYWDSISNLSIFQRYVTFLSANNNNGSTNFMLLANLVKS